VSRLDSKGPEEENADLMRKVAGGDTEALGHLYLRFAPALSRFLTRRGASPDLCEDLVQKIFTDLWERRGHFRAQSSFETYFFGIARNTLHKEMKHARDTAEKSRRNYRASPDQLWKALSEPEAELHLEELRVAIEKALSKLTPAQRQALDYYGDPNSLIQNGSAKSISPDPAYRNRLKRARKRMRELLASILGDES
jgi:RNA polymerase sigma-70 factor (ECF subfamily)